jgi:HSP20 family protein
MMYNTSYGRRSHSFGRGFGPGFRRPKYNVPVNIDDKPDHYLVSIYATGFDREHIKLSVTDDVLLVSGTRNVDENEKFNFIKQEFPVRNFEKKISLEGQVDVAGITARTENGVLLVHLPKTEGAKQPSREIKVD